LAREETEQTHRIGPRLGPELGGAVRTGGANPPGSQGEEIAFKVARHGQKVEFRPEVLKEVEEIVARYPTRQAALLPVLWVAQREFGFIGYEAIEYVAELMGLPPSHVYSVVSFYTMFKPKPEGRFVIQVCTNISCSLGGADEIVSFLKEELGIGIGETTPDGVFTLKTVECLACCEQAPVVQINEDNHFKVTREGLKKLLEDLRSGAEARGR
jgi:NADH-quinone oxidoreductase E subunit